MERKVAFAVSACFFILVFLSQLKLIHHQVRDNDEGIYLTSFLLMEKGHPAYRETFFSQPPGFILAVYPGFLLLGKTLPSARLVIGFWALAGIAALLWAGAELGNRWAGILAASLLFLMPHYAVQTTVLQSDLVVSSMSLIGLASLLRFLKNGRGIWLFVSLYFMVFAFLTKYDMTLIPAVFAGLYLGYRKEPDRYREKALRIMRALPLAGLAGFLLAVVPFGVQGVWQDTIRYRFQALTVRDPLTLGSLLGGDPPLLLAVTLGIFLAVARPGPLKPEKAIIAAWFFFSLLFFAGYHPLFPHHLTLLAVPAALLSSLLIAEAASPLHPRPAASLAVPLFATALFLRLHASFVSPPGLLNGRREDAVRFIKEHTQPGDRVVSDESIILALSGRLPPPSLSDLSLVRIDSGNLTPGEFKRIVEQSRPRLIIAWNGRLDRLKGFPGMLKGYTALAGPEANGTGQGTAVLAEKNASYRK